MLIPTLALLAGAHAARYLNASTEYASGALGASPHQTFKSSPAKPVIFNFQKLPETQPAGRLFITPRGKDVARKGATIVEWDGELVWDGADFGESIGITPTQFGGAPALALWQGLFNVAGYGNGRGLVLDKTYAVVANFTVMIEGHPEASVDFHEYIITVNDTALVTSYVTESANLSAFGGPADGFIMVGYAQEVDIATGKALWTWRSLDHVPPEQSVVPLGMTGTVEDPWDYFHINSIAKDAGGNYLISGRHTNAIYYVTREGSPIWVMGGRNSTLDMGTVKFSYQHDARFYDNGISLFNNAGTALVHDSLSSRGMVVSIEGGKVSLVSESLPFNQTVSESQGNFDRVNNTWIAGWGQVPVVSEHDGANVLWAAQFGVGQVQTYRAHRAYWEGYPTTNPSLAAENGTAYISWNGATQVARWEVLVAQTDTDGDAKESVGNVTKAGFETEISVGAEGFFQVRARDAGGNVIGTSAFVGANGTQGRAPIASPVGPGDGGTLHDSSAERAGFSFAAAACAVAMACAF
ncbi:hypothetical protein CspHIS471_0311560 [Cutaneotrichosporon sp. HIS471]|nr:hypothetical protein CspHIS471_0311560 [Cutaneotrichosporon sp. HIS471]